MFKESFERKSAFDKVLQSVKDCCLSPAGVALAEQMSFMTCYEDVERELGLTDEFLSILLSGKSFPSNDFFDMSSELRRLGTIGTFISLADLNELYLSLRVIGDCLEFFDRAEDESYPLLRTLCVGLEVDKNILACCERLLGPDGDMADNASERLFEIRTGIRRTKMEAERRLRKVLEHSKQQGWTPQEAEATLREGKGVIPVSSANKRRLQGFVIDESASGLTSFIEPAEVVELNNRLRELEFEQMREIVKILTEFTVFLRPNIPMLLECYAFLARIDFLRAKAKYALSIRAGKPILKQKRGFTWYDARHPILQASLQRQGKEIVPLKIGLDDARILIISGPNAGGKSVCLKTVGLLQYMLQCGLLVPMKETSECCLFEDLFFDIGDEQSIENDLSTYSSHLMSMKVLCEAASPTCLFLIDECGTGTEPNAGGAIAEAILENLEKKGAYGIVTTHYSNLKLLSERCKSIRNAAMLFDTKALKPLYRLEIGNAGSSFALEIARTIGLPSDIVASAEEKLGTGFVDYDQALQTIALEKLEINTKQTELQLADELLNSLVEQYKTKNEEIAKREREIIARAKKEANEILKGANRKIEETIRNIKTTKAEPKATKKLREDLNEKIVAQEVEIKTLEKEIKNSPLKEAPPKTHIPLDSSALQEGDIVLIDGQDSYGEVLKLKKGKADVVCGLLNMSLPISRLKKVNKDSYLRQQKQQKNVNRQSCTSLMEDINNLRQSFSYRLDLRGKRADEALSALSKYIDTARLLGESELSVLHGKGDGVLKTVLRDYLRQCPDVESYKAERVEFGGEGITKIKLK